MELKKRKRNDVFLILILLVAGFGILLAQQFLTKEGAKVVVVQDGEILYELSLEENLQGEAALRLESEEGYNLLEIKNGEAFIIEADCPDGLCVKQKAISKQGESLICLPHKLVITVEGVEESGMDAMTY